MLAFETLALAFLLFASYLKADEIALTGKRFGDREDAARAEFVPLEMLADSAENRR